MRSHRFLLGVSVLLGSTGPVHAQLFKKAKDLVIGDTTAPPKYDTAYVYSYHNSMVLSGVTNWQALEMSLKDKQGGQVNYTTNNATKYGFALDWKWLSVEATFAIPALDPADPRYGVTDSRGFGLGYTGRRLWIRTMINGSEGFYSDTPTAVDSTWEPGDAEIVRSDLGSLTVFGNVNYALSGKGRYSQNAALFHVERQKRSAGTFLVGGAIWYSRIHCDSSLVPVQALTRFTTDATFGEARRVVVGVTAGYTHTFVFWQRAFINLALLLGAGFTDMELQVASTGAIYQSRVAGALSEFRAGIGWNDKRWYAALTTAVNSSEADVSEALNLGTDYVTVRFALGWRFRGPQIKPLMSIGLY